MLGIGFIYYQLTKNFYIKEAEFMLHINKSFSENSNLNIIYKKLISFRHGDGNPFSENEISCIAEYLSFFEPIFKLVDRGIITYSDVDKFIPYRFFVAVNNTYVQEMNIVPYAEHYGALFAFYDGWIAYRRKKNKTEPFSEMALSVTFPDYKKFIQNY